MVNSGDSSSEDDMTMFKEALDPSLMSDDMYKNVGNKSNKPDKTKLQKSNRSLDTEAASDPRELNISANMQKFVGKKLSELIDQQICFVEEKSQQNSDDKAENDDSGIRLFSDSKEYVTKVHQEPEPVKVAKKTPRKIEKKEKDPQISNSEKCKLSAIDMDAIMTETQAWTQKSMERKYLLYRRKGDVNYLVEPETEFSEKRKKNNWDETKIALPLYQTRKTKSKG